MKTRRIPSGGKLSRRGRAALRSAARIPWVRRVATWLRAWRGRRKQRKRWRERARVMREWKRRADAGEDICVGCGGSLQRLRVTAHTVLFRERCRLCIGDEPVVSVELTRCTLCGKKDPSRTITAPVVTDRAKLAELGKLVAGVCPDCIGRGWNMRGRS